MEETINVAMLSGREQELLRALIDARALVGTIERELADARQRAAEAQAALTEYYGGAGDAAAFVTPDATIKVWITGKAGEVLREVQGLSEDAQKAVNAMVPRRQGFGSSYRLIARRSVAEELMKAIDRAVLDLELQHTKQGRADAASASASARRIKQALAGA